jgi:hypothetical protein
LACGLDRRDVSYTRRVRSREASGDEVMTLLFEMTNESCLLRDEKIEDTGDKGKGETLARCL